MKIKLFFFFTFLILSLQKFVGPEQIKQSLISISLYQATGLLLFLISAFLVDFFNKKYIYRMDSFFILFFASLIFSSLISLELTSILYSLIFFINSLFIFSIFENKDNNYDSLIVFFTSTLLLLMIFQYLTYGVDYCCGREVGNFEPNQFAILSICVLSAIMFAVQNIYIRIFFSIICFFLASVTISRGGIISLLIFIFVYLFNKYLLNKSFSYIMNLSLKTFFIFFTIALFFYNDIISYTTLILDYFEFFDSTRGLQSGLTGRDVLWINALDSFSDRPVFGVGLRNFDTSAHSAYISLLIEAGLLGFISFFISIIITIKKSIYNLYNNYDEKLNVSIAFIITMLIYGFIERSVLLFTMPNSLLLFFYIGYCININKFNY